MELGNVFFGAGGSEEEARRHSTTRQAMDCDFLPSIGSRSPLFLLARGLLPCVGSCFTDRSTTVTYLESTCCLFFSFSVM